VFIIIFDPGTQFPGNEKITLCNTKKYKNQAGMNLTPPPSVYSMCCEETFTELKFLVTVRVIGVRVSICNVIRVGLLKTESELGLG